MKGKVVINFEQTEDGKCEWNINQEGDDKLSNDDILYLLENVMRDVMEKEG